MIAAEESKSLNTPPLPPPPPATAVLAAVDQNSVESINTSNNTPLKAKNNLQPPISSISSSATPLIASNIINEKNESISSTAPTPAGNRGRFLSKPPDEFYKDLYQFHEKRSTPVTHIPKISGRTVDLHRLYNEVLERGGFSKVNNRDEWDEVISDIGLREKCVNATAAIKYIYRRYLEKYERVNYFGEDPDKIDNFESAESIDSSIRRGRYPSIFASSNSNASSFNTVPMSYNYRQHIVSAERRRLNKMSTDLHKPSPYEKLMLSLISPLPNEQDFAINVCALMANESKHSLKINEHPRLLDVLLAHCGVFSDVSLRELFQDVYTKIRQNSLYGFWRDLLHDKPQILDLYTDEKEENNNNNVYDIPEKSDSTGSKDDSKSLCKEHNNVSKELEEIDSMDFLNLGRPLGTQDVIGQRIQLIVSILRNLSFFDEHMPIFAKSRTFIRFVVMCANIRWGNIHIQALDTAGNIASEIELQDPTTDELTRNFMATICEGIESQDRAVILDCLEILQKLCQKDSNEDHIIKCLNLKFFETISLYLSLNDIMLLIYTLEAIYTLTSLGTRCCHMVMQVRGIIDQLMSLITVEAQSYGSKGCILMRVIETVPGVMLPMVAQNIANLQTVAGMQHQSLKTVVAPQTVQFVNPPQLGQQQKPQSPVVITTTTIPQVLEQPKVAGIIVEQKPANETTSMEAVVQQPGVTSAKDNNSTQLELTPAPAPALQMPQNFSHEDEQYALAWVGATFERTGINEARVEQQELYRMYLAHCQKSGKHSVVNHLQFPRLVRLIFSQSVGPMIVRSSDGKELPGTHYIGIKARAIPLQIQTKTTYQLPQTPNKMTPAGAGPVKQEFLLTTPKQGRRRWKNVQPVLQQQQQNITQQQNVSQQHQSTQLVNIQKANENTTHVVVAASSSISTPVNIPTIVATTATTPVIGLHSNLPSNLALHPVTSVRADSPGVNSLIVTSQPGSMEEQQLQQSIISSQPSLPVPPLAVVTPNTQESIIAGHQPSTSVIKSLLATKVTQRQLKHKELVATTSLPTISTPSVITSTNAVAQQRVQPSTSTSSQPLKLPSTAISALVNNPLMQNTPVKVGQTTIKPLSMQTQMVQGLDRKPAAAIESKPPPLAPLSGTNVSKDASGRPIILTNQLLVAGSQNTTSMKRKIEDNLERHDSNKRLVLSNNPDSGATSSPGPSKSAANLYASLAASVLEGEDLDEIAPPPMQQQQPNVKPMSTQQPQQNYIVTSNKLQQPSPAASPSLMTQQQQHSRQLIFQASPTQNIQQQQTHTRSVPSLTAQLPPQSPQGMPVILQQKPLLETTNSSGPSHHHTQLIQPQQTTTQYVLATNAQGQTYIVAQQQPVVNAPPTTMASTAPSSGQTQTVLVTQTPQQQSTGAKTIIILQQQPMSGSPGSVQQQQILSGGSVGGQKMIMTTPQGQQVLLTQRPTTIHSGPGVPSQHQQQIIINPQTGAATHIQVPVTSTLVSGNPGTSMQQRQVIHSAMTSGQQTTMQQQNMGAQMSPSLLSQLNHIPATIKLHQPATHLQQNQSQQTAYAARLGKSVSIVQTSTTSTPTSSGHSTPNHTPAPSPTPQAMQIPQLQQHPSIIQQHIISGGPSEKRQVILSGGRAIEIKETIITQAPPPSQQSQLNSQTIITSQLPHGQPQPAGGSIMQQKIVSGTSILQPPQSPSPSTSTHMNPMHSDSNPKAQTLIPPLVTQSGGPIIKKPLGVAGHPKEQQQHDKPMMKPGLLGGAPPPPVTNTQQQRPQLITTTSSVAAANISNNIQMQHQLQLQHQNREAKRADTLLINTSTQNIIVGNSTAPATTYTITSSTASTAVSSTVVVPTQITMSSALGMNLNKIVTVSSATNPQQIANVTMTNSGQLSIPHPQLPQPQLPQVQLPQLPMPQLPSPLLPTPSLPVVNLPPPIDANWLYICDWRNCPRRKFKSLNELQYHTCSVHCPDHLDPVAEIFCQWGAGPGLCDGIPRKRYSLMTHLMDRHLTVESLKSAVQRRIATGTVNMQPVQPPVTIVRNLEQTAAAAAAAQQQSSTNNTSAASSNSPGSLTGTTALQAIKRHTADYVNSKDFADEKEGPVTKSIRLTAALILRNLVTYSDAAKRKLRRYESHLSNVALSNVEASVTVSHILFEMNN